MMAGTTKPEVHKVWRAVFGKKSQILTVCGELLYNPPDGDFSYKWSDVACLKCKALEPKPLGNPIATEKR